MAETKRFRERLENVLIIHPDIRMATPWLRVSLSPEEDQTLLELRTATTVPQRTKDRAQALRLNHRGWTTEQIAEYFGWQVATVRNAIHRWKEKGLCGLWDAARQGRPKCWQEEDMAFIEQSIQQEEKTLNSRQLVEQLQKERQVKLSRRHLDGC